MALRGLRQLVFTKDDLAFLGDDIGIRFFERILSTVRKNFLELESTLQRSTW